MEYSESYKTNCKITLDSGIEIIMDELKQERFYAGTLEGGPQKEHTDATIEYFKKEKKKHELFIEPPQINTRFEDGSASIYVWLPQILCRANFHSIYHKDPDLDESYGTIIWFQDLFALPIQDNVLRQIKKMDWYKHSFESNY